jgi:hypothetical protein
MASAGTTGGKTRCPSCSAPLIRQQVGPLSVKADAVPIRPGTDAQIRGPNRLTWCLPPANRTTPRLRWISASTHPTDCPHPHHADHHCTRPAAPQTASTEQSALF